MYRQHKRSNTIVNNVTPFFVNFIIKNDFVVLFLGVGKPCNVVREIQTSPAGTYTIHADLLLCNSWFTSTQ